jgi:hypothetical protein
MAACSGFNPWGDPTSEIPYVHITVANQQPQSPILGVVMNVQAGGCAGGSCYLTLGVEGGTLRLFSAHSVEPVQGACVARLVDPVQFVVTPDAVEAILFGKLYAQEQSSDGTPGTPCVRFDAPLAYAVVPVIAAANNVNVPLPTDASVDGGGASPDAGPQDAGALDAGTTDPADGGV